MADDELKDNFILLADIFPTACQFAEPAKAGLGSTVAIYGAGPCGLPSVMSSRLKGMSEDLNIHFRRQGAAYYAC